MLTKSKIKVNIGRPQILQALAAKLDWLQVNTRESEFKTIRVFGNLTLHFRESNDDAKKMEAGDWRVITDQTEKPPFACIL